jgi:hypothetical protein
MQRIPLHQRENEEDKVVRGLAKLVIGLVQTLKELMEKQARRRIREGFLTVEEQDRLGLTFMQLNNKIEELAKVFHLDRQELSLAVDTLDSDYPSIGEGDYSPPRSASLADLLNSIIEKGALVLGQLEISVADVDLINAQLLLVLNSIKDRKKKVLKTDQLREKLEHSSERDHKVGYAEPKIIVK